MDFVTRNAIDGISSRRTQLLMYTSARSTLLSKVGPISGGTARIQSIGFSEMHRLFVGYLGDYFIEANPGEIVNEAGFSALLQDVCKGG